MSRHLSVAFRVLACATVFCCSMRRAQGCGGHEWSECTNNARAEAKLKSLRCLLGAGNRHNLPNRAISCWLQFGIDLLEAEDRCNLSFGCAPGLVCQNGHCAKCSLSCDRSKGLVLDPGTCQCVCPMGSCSTSCPMGTTHCSSGGGICFTDPPCSGGTIDLATCLCTCPSGAVLCGGSCVQCGDHLVDPATCACGACAPVTCANGQSQGQNCQCLSAGCVPPIVSINTVANAVSCQTSGYNQLYYECVGTNPQTCYVICCPPGWNLLVPTRTSICVQAGANCN